MAQLRLNFEEGGEDPGPGRCDCHAFLIVCGWCGLEICPECDCDVGGSCETSVFCNGCSGEVESSDGSRHVCGESCDGLGGLRPYWRERGD